MPQWLSYPTFTGPFSGQEQLLAASSTSPGAGMIRIPWSAVNGLIAGTGFLPLTGGTLTGPLTLAGNATLPLQAVPLQQVEAITGGPFLQLAGGTLTGQLILAADPTAALGAATKEYVDGAVAGGSFLPLTGGTVTGPIVLPGNATLPLQAVPLQQVTAIIGGPYLPLAGGTLTGALVLAADPTLSLGAATKHYVDAAVVSGPFLPLAGGTVTGATTFSADVTFSGAGTGLAVSNNATVGGTFVATGGINGTPVGAVTPSTGAFTNLTASGTVTLPSTTTGPFLLLTGGTVSGPTTFSGSGTALTVTNNATVGGTLITTGLATFNGGGTFTAGPAVHISRAAGLFRTIQFETSGVARFSMGLDNSAESGSNAGSNFVVSSFADSGAALNSSFFSFNRNTGTTAFNAPVTQTVAIAAANVTSSAGTGFLQTTSVTGTKNFAAIQAFNQWNCSFDTAALTGQFLFHTAINYNFGGGSFTGNRGGLFINMTQTGAVAGSSGAGGIVPLQVGVVVNNTFGGTNSGTGAAGAITSANFNTVITAAGTNLLGTNGLEIDVEAHTGAVYHQLAGMTVVSTTAHQQAGLRTLNAGYAVYGQTNSAGLDIGYTIGGWALTTTGTIFLAQFSNSRSTFNIGRGFDLRPVAFSNDIFAASGFSVSSTGRVRVGTGYFDITSTGVALSVDGAICTAGSLTGAVATTYPSDGGAYFVDDGLGGLWEATFAITTSSITAITQVGAAASVKGAPPSNPITLTPVGALQDFVPGAITANLTWNTSKTELDIQPSGGVVKLGSGCFTANASTAVTLTALAPAGAHSTVQEWLTITDSAGTVRYIPCF